MQELTVLTSAEIDAIESRLQVRLPSLYRDLLAQKGYGLFGQEPDVKWNTSKEIYHPESIAELYRDLFDDPSVLLSRYFPFGCDNDRQEVWVIDNINEKIANISHETHPDDWCDESWFDYGDWKTPSGK